MANRRSLLKSAIRIPLAAVLSQPVFAGRMPAMLRTVETTTRGGTIVRAAWAVPVAKQTGAILLIHEHWGLNAQIKALTAEFASLGYAALAVDLFAGRVAAEIDSARALTRSVDPKLATETLAAWIRWLRAQPDGNGRVGTVGWRFGGGWSLNASLAAPVDATVVYYGRVDKTAAELADLRGPVLGHFAQRDPRVDQQMVSGFSDAMYRSGKDLIAYWYDAQAAFANPSSTDYDADDARLAWARTLAFLKERLAG